MLDVALISCLILALATAIQSVVGFGMALFAVPLLVMVGTPLLPAVFLVLSISCASSLLGVARLKGDFDIRESLRASVSRMIGVVPGYFLALQTVKGSPAALKAAMGLVIAIGVFAQVRKMVTARPEETTMPPSEPCPKLAPYAFVSSGFFMGWLGMGGPPLVFWLLTGRQEPKRSRGFLFGVYLITVPFQLALMAYHDPSTVEFALPVLLLAGPLCLFVTWFALKLGNRLEVRRLQKLSLALLSLLALKALGDWAVLVV